MKRFYYENFTDDKINEILDNIINDCYEILSNYKYGEYKLNIYNERENISISLSNEIGSAESEMSKKIFIECIKDFEFEKVLDHDLYYNFQSDEM